MSDFKQPGLRCPTKCEDQRPCFAKSSKGTCMILRRSYDTADKLCPFCKPDRGNNFEEVEYQWM